MLPVLTNMHIGMKYFVNDPHIQLAIIKICPFETATKELDFCCFFFSLSRSDVILYTESYFRI